MKKVNWGIIGLGGVANKFADGFKYINNASIKGIASKDINKLNSFKNKFNIEEKFCYNNYIDLISDQEIDIIYIALPNTLHVPLIIKCIEHEKNILVEKPAISNLEDLYKVKNLILNSKIFFTEGFMYRYLPYLKKIKQLIENNTLGSMLDMESFFYVRVYKVKNFFGFKFKKPDFSHRLFNKELGGGAILDLGCYPLSLSTFLNSINNPTNIENIVLTNIKTISCESDVDIFSSAEINFNNKFKSKIYCSFKDKMSQRTLINFEKGFISVNESWTPQEEMEIQIEIDNVKKSIKFVNYKNIYSHQIENISDQLLNKNKSPIFPSISLNEIELNTKILSKWLNNN